MSSRLVEWLLAVLLLAAAALSPRLIPHNMDEFSAYHMLGCERNALSAQYNDFETSCRADDLKLPGTSTYLPLRAYTYLGVAQTFAFLPFWALIDDPVAGRIFGAACLMFAAWCIGRLTGTRWRYALLASLWIPIYSMAFIEETGSASVPVCALLVLMLLMRRALNATTDGAQCAYALASGLTAFLCFYMKPVFAWVMPALAMWLFWLWIQRDARRPIPWRAVSVAALAFAVPLLLLLFSTDRAGRFFFQVASGGGLNFHPRSILTKVYWMGMLVTNSALFDLRVLAIADGLLLDAIPALLALVALATLLWSRWRQKVGSLWAMLEDECLFYAFLAGFTFLIVCCNESAWAAHHMAFALLFLTLSLSAAIPRLAGHWRQWPVLISVVMSGYWATLVARLPQAYIHNDTNFDKDRLVRFIRSSGLDASSVQFHTDWGTYYLSNTFGHREQLVAMQTLYWFPRDKQREVLLRIRSVAKKLDRDLLLIGQESTGARRDPLVVELLGQPRQVYDFNTWSMARYRFDQAAAADAVALDIATPRQ
jgi:hypothetical protein